MSLTHLIDGIFEAKFTAKVITKIFEKGEDIFFTYHVFLDDNWRKIPTGARLSPALATEKILEYPNNPEQQEYGPMVGAIHTAPLGNKNTLHLRISKADHSDFLKVSWCALDQHHIKFTDGTEGVDCPFYIKKFVDIYSGFV